MNYQQVKQFLTIVKHMNLSKAANELYISQPALSLALGRLEAELDVQLFYRDGRKLIISPAGEYLYNYFKDLKDAHDRLTDAAEEFHRHGQSHSVTIGFSVSAELFSTLYMSGKFNSFQNIAIKKIFGDEEQIPTLLKNGMIDFAVTCPPIADDKITNQVILSEPYVLVVSAGHPMASRESVSTAELKGLALTGLKKHQPARRQNDLVFQQNHFTPDYVCEYDYPEYYAAVRECAHTDRFAAVVPEEFFEKTYKEGYAAIPFSDGSMVRQTALSWLTEKNYNLEYRELFAYIANGIREQQEYHRKFSEILSNVF